MAPIRPTWRPDVRSTGQRQCINVDDERSGSSIYPWFMAPATYASVRSTGTMGDTRMIATSSVAGPFNAGTSVLSRR